MLSRYKNNATNKKYKKEIADHKQKRQQEQQESEFQINGSQDSLGFQNEDLNKKNTIPKIDITAIQKKKEDEIDLDYIPMYVKKKLVAYGNSELLKLDHATMTPFQIKCHKIHQSKPLHMYFWLVRTVYILMAFFMRPPWCSAGEEQEDGTTKQFNHECTNYEGNDEDILYPNAGMYHLENYVYIFIECWCIISLSMGFVVEVLHTPKDKVTQFIKAKKIMLPILNIILMSYVVLFFQGTAKNWPFNMPLRIPYLILFYEVLRSFMITLFRLIKGVIPVAMVVAFICLILFMLGMIVEEGTGLFELHIEEAWDKLFILATTANYPDVMLDSYNVSTHHFLFFLFYTVATIFIMNNIVLGKVYAVFEGTIESDFEDMIVNHHQLFQTKKFFKEIADGGKRPDMLVYEIKLEEGDPNENFLIKVFNSLYWSIFMSLLTFILTISVIEKVERTSVVGYAIYIGINIFLIIEQIVRLVLIKFRVKKYVGVVFDLVMLCALLAANVVLMTTHSEPEEIAHWETYIFELLQVMRIYRVMYFTFHFHICYEFYMVFMMVMMKIPTLGYSYFVIMYVFGLFVLFFFGGTVRTDLDFSAIGASDNYYLNNCNDLLGGVITLYVSMVGNNWFVVRDVFVIKSGRFALYFFNFWFVLNDTILMNVLIGYIVDIYESVHAQCSRSEEDVYDEFLYLMDKLKADTKKILDVKRQRSKQKLLKNKKVKPLDNNVTKH